MTISHKIAHQFSLVSPVEVATVLGSSAITEHWFGGNLENADFLFNREYDFEQLPLGWLVDPQVAPSSSFIVVESHFQFLWRLLPAGLHLACAKMTYHELVLATRFLRALTTKRESFSSAKLVAAVADHADRLERLRTLCPEAYRLLIQMRLGELIDDLAGADDEAEYLGLISNHACFMAMHALKMVGILGAVSQRNPLPSIVDGNGLAIKIGRGEAALHEIAKGVIGLLSGSSIAISDCCELQIGDRDILPLAKEIHEKYLHLSYTNRRRFRREWGAVAAHALATSTKCVASTRPIGHIFPVVPASTFGRNANPMAYDVNCASNGYTDNLKGWVGFTPVEAAALAGITLAFALDDMALWIDARRQNVRYVRTEKLRSGSKQVAISACEVLREIVRDKDYAIRKTSDPTGGRSPASGHLVIKRMLGVLNAFDGRDTRPLTIQPERWLFAAVAEDGTRI